MDGISGIAQVFDPNTGGGEASISLGGFNSQSTPQRTIEFPPVHIHGERGSGGISPGQHDIPPASLPQLGIPPSSPDIAPAQPTIPRHHSSLETASASPDARVTSSDPRTEITSPQVAPTRDIFPTPNARLTTESPPTEASNLHRDRFSTEHISPDTFFDRTEAGRLPAFYRDPPDKQVPQSSKRKKQKHQRRPRILPNPIVHGGVAVVADPATRGGEPSVALGGLTGEVTSDTIQRWVEDEDLPGLARRTVPIAYDDDSVEHITRVIAIINHFIAENKDTRGLNKQDILEMAHSQLVSAREVTDRNSQSILLRDAERYLWGRMWLGYYGNKEFKGNIYAWTLEHFPETSDRGYNILKIILKETPIVKSNKDRSASIQGGSTWFLLGLSDGRLDTTNDNDFIRADAGRFYQFKQQ